jgi:hypothetical protein
MQCSWINYKCNCSVVLHNDDDVTGLYLKLKVTKSETAPWLNYHN